MSTQALRSSPKSAKPWSSGRVLSSAQREAKRQKDRITKRTKAQEQKDRLDDLEGRIKSLQNFIQAHLGSCSSLPSGALPSDYSFGSSLVQLSSTSQPFHCGTSSIQLPASSKDPSIALDPEAEVTAPVPQSFSDNFIDELNNGCTIPFSLNDDGTCTILQFSNQVFEKTLQLDIVELCSNDQLNQDAIIRGVLEGWHTLKDRPYLCPLWSLLSQIDERIFMQSGILTRFAMLRMIHLMLLNAVHIHSFGSLPPWYRPRPTQLKFAHQAIADYFAWPGLRERLVLSNCEVLSDRFFKYFASCFRLFWPYPICDAYRMDPANNLYHFSNIFDKHVGEIRMWTMNKEFFEIFPELYDDIALEAPSLDVPMTLTNEDLGDLGTTNILCDVSS